MIASMDNMAHHKTSNPKDDYRWYVISGGISAIVLAFGLFIFASNVEWRETYHGWYVLGFCVCTIGFSVLLGLRRFVSALFFLALIGGIIDISMQKFAWRKALLAEYNDPKAITVFGPYASELPPLEEYWMGSDTPDWVRFERDCYQPAMTGQPVASTCKTKNDISGTYRIDLMSVINQHYSKMRATAQKIANNTLPNGIAYKSCLASQSCEAVPLLPKTVDPKTIATNAEDYKEIRIAFWNLVDKDKVSLELCDYITLCKLMTATGAITRTDFPTN